MKKNSFIFGLCLLVGLSLICSNSFADTQKVKQVRMGAPGVMDVAPEDMYETWQAQYRLLPDQRFVNGLEVLRELAAGYCGIAKAEFGYSFTSEMTVAGKLQVTLRKNGSVVKRLTLDTPLTFSEQVRSMRIFLETMSVPSDQTQQQRDSVWEGELLSVLNDFHMVDARAIIKGMERLETLGGKNPFDSRLFLAAARGYALLLSGLGPDRMGYTKKLDAKALAFLVFAKHIDPECRSDRASAFVAHTLGYTGFADRLLNTTDEPSGKIDRLIGSFIRKDIKTLEKTKGEGSKFFGYYLLAKLYREAGLKEKAGEEIRALHKRVTDNYPVLVETIYSDDFNRAKMISGNYCRTLLYGVMKQAGRNGCSDMSFETYDEILAAKRITENRSPKSVFISSDDMDCIYRSLYSGAVHLRFDFLNRRWSVFEKAKRLSEGFSRNSSGHPQALFMKGVILAKGGQRKEAESVFMEILTHSDSSPQLLLAAYEKIDVYTLKRKGMLPALIARMDSRPSLLPELGRLFSTNLNYDYAGRCYRAALELDPFAFHNYKKMAGITGSDTVLKNALKRYPGHIQMQMAAGGYYAERNDGASLILAESYYRKALEVAPSSSKILFRLSFVLKKQKRYAEAGTLLRNWVEKWGRRDNSTSIAWAEIADCALKEGEVLSAVEILVGSEDLYRLIQMNIAGGARDESIQMIRKNADVMNSVMPLIRQRSSEEAVQILTKMMAEVSAALLRSELERRSGVIREWKTPYMVNSYLYMADAVIRRLNSDGGIHDDDLTKLIIHCIESGESSAAVDMMEGAVRRYERAAAFLSHKEDDKALRAVSVNTDDYQRSVIVQTAAVYEALNQLALAEKTIRKGLTRYKTYTGMYRDAASFMWRNGRYGEAALMIAEGAKREGRFSGWFIDAFMDIFAEQQEEKIIQAIHVLLTKGIDRWYAGSIGHRFFMAGHPEIAFKLVSELPARGFMERLEKLSKLYTIIRDWKGERAAVAFLKNNVTGDARSMMAAALFADGHYRPVVSLLGNPDSFSRYQSFVWLQRYVAWIANEKRPADLEPIFRKHYARNIPDYYHAIGQYLSGEISQKDLLQLVRTPKQRCEISYYIGFAERMKGDFPVAADWYQICCETGLENNGEYHWAFTELFWWGHMGTTGRHRRVLEDKKEYYRRRSL